MIEKYMSQPGVICSIPKRNVASKGWRTMKTAPQDGSRFLVTFTPLKDWKFSQRPVFQAVWDAVGQVWSCCGFDQNMGSNAIQLHFTEQQLKECDGMWRPEPSGPAEKKSTWPTRQLSPAEEKAAEFIEAVAEERQEVFALEEVIRIVARFFPEYITIKEDNGI